MNEYIMAIKPEWVERIEAREKTLEIRRTKPKTERPIADENPIKVWVYESKAAGRGKGKIVGHFVCRKIRRFDARRDDLELRRAARVPWHEMKEYQGDRGHLFAWEISRYTKLAVPLPLEAVGCYAAPQSWCKRRRMPE